MRVFAKVYETVIHIVVGVLLVCALGLEVPKFFGIMPFIVQSGSMEPVVHTGSVVFTNTNDRDAKVGDIISYKIQEGDEEVMVLHRVVAIDGDNITTKGDANEAIDGVAVTKSMVVGKYVFAIPQIGFLLAKLTTKVKIVVIAWLFILIVISFIFNKIVDSTESEDDKCGAASVMDASSKGVSGNDETITNEVAESKTNQPSGDDGKEGTASSDVADSASETNEKKEPKAETGTKTDSD